MTPSFHFKAAGRERDGDEGGRRGGTGGKEVRKKRRSSLNKVETLYNSLLISLMMQKFRCDSSNNAAVRKRIRRKEDEQLG